MEQEITLESQETQEAAAEQEKDLTEREEKTFTQEEVNRIIQKRLKERKEEQKALEDIATKTAELEQREIKLECKEYLIEKGYPKELLDIISTSEVKNFKEKADMVHALMNSKESFVAPLASHEHYGEHAGSFEKVKHVPRKY